MSTDKLSELKAVADYWRKVKSGELHAPGPNEISITVCTLDAAVSRISALLAELAAKDKRIAELEQNERHSERQNVIDGLAGAGEAWSDIEEYMVKWDEERRNG